MYRRHIILALTLTTSLAACGSDPDPNENNSSGTPPEGQAVKITEHLQAFEVTEAPFFRIMQRYDFNGDEVLDSEDVEAIQVCVTDSTISVSPECDVVPDGKLNTADIRLLDLLVGGATPRSAEDIARAADTLAGIADGPFTQDFLGMTIDYNDSGGGDVADMTLIVDALRADPVGKFDFDESGSLDLRDVAILTAALPDISGDAGAPGFDVTGDGTLDEADALMLGELTLYTSDLSIGLLDHNLDGQVDLSDYCVVTPAPAESSLLGMVMTDLDAQAVTAKSALCRDDARSVYRAPMNINTGQRVVLLPEALYLKLVTEVPVGMGLLGEVTPDMDLYIVTDEVTENPLKAFDLPGFTGFEDETPRFEVTGPTLAEGATLIVPTGFVAMVPNNPGNLRALVSSTSIEYSIDVVSILMTEDQRADAKDFEEKVNAALRTYDGYLQCPCELDAATRAQLVQGLLRMKSCLGAVRSAAQSAVEDARSNHGRITLEHQFRGRLAATQWQFLSQLIVDIEWVKTALLVLETTYDWGTGGPANALKGAVENLASEEFSDATSSDFFDSSAPGSPAGDTLNGMSVATGASLVTKPFADSITELLGKGVAKLGPAAFGRALLDNVGKNIGQFDVPNMEAFIKNFIKLLPVLYLEYMKTYTFQIEHQASEAAGDYNESVFTIGNWEHVVSSMDGAIAATDMKLQQLLAKMAADGCAMTITSADPCQPVLQTSLQAASDKLTADLDAANGRIDAALKSLSGTEIQESCLTGDRRRVLDSIQLGSADRARAVAELVGKVDIKSVQEQLKIEVASSTASKEAGVGTYQAQCFGVWLERPMQSDMLWTELAAANAAKQTAIDEHQAAVSAAIVAYQTCSVDGGGACAGSSTVASNSPWTAAAGCMSCVPEVVMECGPPMDALSLGMDLDLTDVSTGYTAVNLPMFEHSSTMIGSKPTAWDGTTIGGYYQGTVTWDAAAVAGFDSQFPCSDASVFCAASQPMLAPGNYEVYIVQHMGMLPITDMVNFYQYALVFDADNSATNNYMASPEYQDDYFQGTDTWLQLQGMGASGFAYTKSVMMNGSPVEVMSDARLIVRGNAMAHVVPQTEVSFQNSGGLRFSAFRHAGDYGLQGGEYDGSVFPTNSTLFMP